MYQYDFYSFLDSKEMLDNAKDITYTPAEQAVLIIRSRKKTVAEKMKALVYLLETYSENEFGEEKIQNTWRGTILTSSFRQNVEMTLSIWKQMLEDRFDEEGVMFAVAFLPEEVKHKEIGDYHFFSSYEKAYKRMKELKISYDISSGKDSIQSSHKKTMSAENLATKTTETGHILRLIVDGYLVECDAYDEFIFNERLELVDLRPHERRYYVNRKRIVANLAEDCEIF